MDALGPLRSFSLPLDDRYAQSVSDWTGTHGGYTDIAADGLYTHGAGDWAVDHAPYTDADGIDLSSEASEGMNADDDVPSWQQMWTATHPDAVEEGGAAFGSAASVDGSALAADALSGDYASLAAAVTGGALPTLAAAGWAGDPALAAAALGQRDDLDDAFEEDPLDDVSTPAEFTPSGMGSASLTIERGAAPQGHQVPNDTTSVIVSVPGTDIHEYVVFPDINPTLDITLPDMPCGEQDVVIESFSGTTLVGRGEFIVNVAPRAGGPSDPNEATAAKDATVAKDAITTGGGKDGPAHLQRPTPPPPTVVADVGGAVPQDRWSDVHEAIVSPDPGPPRFASSALPPTRSTPADPRPTSDSPSSSPAPVAPDRTPATTARAEVATLAGDATVARTAASVAMPLAEHANPAGEAYTPGQVMAAALTSSTRIVGAATAASSAVTAAEWVGVEVGVPMVLAGAIEIFSGFHRRDYDGVWRGSMKSQAGGLIFAGSLMASPPLTALGALLARAYEAGT